MIAIVTGQVGRYKEFIGMYRTGTPIHIPASEKYSGFEIRFYDPPQDRPWIGVAVGFVSYHDDTIADLVDVWFLESPQFLWAPGVGDALFADYDEPQFLDYVKLGVYLYTREIRHCGTLLYDNDTEPDWNRDPEVDDRPVDPAEYAYEFQVS